MNLIDGIFGREAMNFNRVWIPLVVVAFALTISVSLASADYVVIKDVNGICRVIQSTHKTPKTIEGGGPFKTKEEAVKVKEEKCASAKTPAKEKPVLLEKEKAKEKEPGLLDKIKEKAKDKEKAKQELKEKAEKAKQALKEKQEKAKKDKEEKAKQKKDQKAKDKDKDK